jgi:DNA-binding transcriptional MerR regulator
MRAGSTDPSRRKPRQPTRDGTHTIGELAARFDVTPRTLRHYEEIGLLAPLRKGSSRLYDERDVSRLKLILRGKRLGFALEDTRELFALYDAHKDGSAHIPRFMALIARRRALLEQQIQDIHSALVEIDACEVECRAALAALGKRPNGTGRGKTGRGKAAHKRA